MTEAQRKFRVQVVVAFGLVYVLWGSTYLGIRIAVEDIPPAMMGALRFLISGSVMLAWCALSGRRIKLSGREFLHLGIIGVLLLTTGNVVLGWAETYIPSGLAALLIAITPLYFILLETLSSRGDHLSRRGLAGIALGVLGVIALLWPDIARGMRVGGRELFGAALVLFSSFSWATGSVLSKRWHSQTDPYTSSAWEMTIAGVVNLLIAVSLGDHHHVTWAPRSMGAILYLVVAGSWVGFTAYIWLLRNVPTPKVATYAYINPIVAVFLGWLVLGERITVNILLGSVIIIVGVVLVTGAKLKPRERVPVEEPELPAVESDA
ncbi:MAG TPA: EamA family transporter [Clostridia bacterium]|nr:EamA family transporter [Clostridia bacterium]